MIAPTAPEPMRAAPVSVLEAQGLAFAYRSGGEQRPVLRGVELRLVAGELAALLGTNGSGKTTLLRLLAGTLRPDAGAVLLAGRRVPDWSRRERARRVAVLPQQLELPAGFRVGEIVAMGRSPHARGLFSGSAEDELAVERALHDADVAALADRRVEELSGGERQRVLVALALAQEPAVLLLDEPTVHLDLAHQLALWRTVERLRAQRGIAVLAVLHDLSLAALAPRVLLLDDGRIAADGPPDQVLRPDAVRRVFRVALDEALTPDGRRHLVPPAPQ